MSLIQELDSSFRRYISRISSDSDGHNDYFDWDHYLYIMIFETGCVRDTDYQALKYAASSFQECKKKIDSLLDSLMRDGCENLVLCTKLINCIAVYENSENLDNSETFFDALNTWYVSRLGGEIYPSMQRINAIHFIAALRRGDAKLLRLFIKYGITLSAFKQEDEKQEIIRTLKRFYCYALKCERDMVLPDRRELVLPSVTTYYRYINVSERLEAKEHTRVMQVLFGVEAILLKRRGDGTHQDYVECLRLYFCSISSPLISTSEIRSVLDKLGCKPLFVDILCRDFNELFPEFPKTHLAPRSLKELCRPEVREILRDRSEQHMTTLPVAVSELRFSHILKRYLLLECC